MCPVPHVLHFSQVSGKFMPFIPVVLLLVIFFFFFFLAACSHLVFFCQLPEVTQGENKQRNSGMYCLCIELSSSLLKLFMSTDPTFRIQVNQHNHPASLLTHS